MAPGPSGRYGTRRRLPLGSRCRRRWCAGLHRVWNRVPRANHRRRKSSWQGAAQNIDQVKVLRCSPDADDEDGIVVIGIACRDNACVDALGNRVGGSLRQALGNEADCDQGDELTCESIKLTGLAYIVRENNKCALRVTEGGKRTGIPACARIGGFYIAKK
jgi:hypothetical protein